jgi:phage terminase large subunit
VANAFMPADLVSTAMRRGPADVQPVGGLRVGLDVARFGDDKSAITIRRGRVVLKQIVLAKLDVAQVAARCKMEIDAFKEKPEQIAVDTIGVGAGAADMLRAWYPDFTDRRTGRLHKVVDVNSASRMADGSHYNLRAFMWAQMKEWMREGSIPNDNDLKVDLTALRYNFKGGELILESKEDAKRRGVKSPDRADSLAMTFAVPTIVRADKHTARLPRYKGCLG